ncbi:hypothetical protein NP233_g100 [Leucocoprinus birnbaumii]|uniref:Uncharacterized protein n=1 Tax=Leucocoprinus birnbaumii TaxID=56174 RepID=A0AAD5W5Y9_9AGAR|nr:hypothetical protein NP233_g100 [Leucocoprinus birnbaumii]
MSSSLGYCPASTPSSPDRASLLHSRPITLLPQRHLATRSASLADISLSDEERREFNVPGPSNCRWVSRHWHPWLSMNIGFSMFMADTSAHLESPSSVYLVNVNRLKLNNAASKARLPLLLVTPAISSGSFLFAFTFADAEPRTSRHGDPHPQAVKPFGLSPETSPFYYAVLS